MDVELLESGVVGTAMDIFRFDDNAIAIEDESIDGGGDCSSEDRRALEGGSGRGDGGTGKTGSGGSKAAAKRIRD